MNRLQAVQLSEARSVLAGRSAIMSRKDAQAVVDHCLSEIRAVGEVAYQRELKKATLAATSKPAPKKTKTKVKAKPQPAEPQDQPDPGPIDDDGGDDDDDDDDGDGESVGAFSFARLDASAQRFIRDEAVRSGRSVSAVLSSINKTRATPPRNRSIRDLGEADATAVRMGFDGGRAAAKQRRELGLPNRDAGARLPRMFISHGPPPPSTPTQTLAQAQHERDEAKRQAGAK
jgi:hypothetical protein